MDKYSDFSMLTPKKQSQPRLKKHFTFCDLSKINLVILYINRHINHQTPLPEKILLDNLQILEEFRASQCDMEGKAKIKKGQDRLRLRNQSCLKKNEDKVRIKKIGNFNYKDENANMEIKVLSSEKVIERLRNEILNHQIKISECKKLISKQNQSLQVKQKSLLSLKQKILSLQSKEKEEKIYSKQSQVQISIPPNKISFQIHDNKQCEILKNVLIQRQNQIKNLIMICLKDKND